MNKLNIYNFKGNDIRVVAEFEGKPWFIARDVAIALGYNNPSKYVKKFCEDAVLVKTSELGVLKEELNAPRGVLLIPEADVYELIFSSKLPSAKEFRRWVTKIVLPSIRENGGYIRNQEKLTDGENALTNEQVQLLANAVEACIERSLEKHSDKAAMSLKPLTEEQKQLVSDHAVERSFAKAMSGLKEGMKDMLLSKFK